jgi:hypothetical protein
MSSRNKIHNTVLDFWKLKNNSLLPEFPLLEYTTAGYTWEIFSTFEHYFGRLNHLMFEPYINSDRDYLIDKTENYFIVEFDERKGFRYPQFIKSITKGEIFDMIKRSEINELKMYEGLETAEKMIENLLLERFSY